MHMDTLAMQGVLANYVSSKSHIEGFLRGEEELLPGTVEDLLSAVIGFFRAEEWGLCSEACSYLDSLEGRLKENGESLQDYVGPRWGSYLELVKLLCRLLRGIKGDEKISREDLEKLREISRDIYAIAPDIVRDVFTVLKKHLGEDALKELNIPEEQAVTEPGVPPEWALDSQIATIEIEFSVGRINAKTLLSGGMDEARAGYYILLSTRNLSRAFELFFVTGEERGMKETWELLEGLKRLSKERSLSLTKDPYVYRPLRAAEALHGLWLFMGKSKPVPKDNLSNAISVLSKERSPLRRETLLRIKDYLESHNFEVPEELVKALESFPKPREVDYWEEYQRTLGEFDEKARKFLEEAKKEWERVKSGEAEDQVGSIQNVIKNLSEAVVYNFALRRFKPVKEAYEIFLQAYEFAKENNLFKTKLSEDVWLGKLKRVNLKWGNDVRWHEDYRIIANRIIRLARMAEFMMWRRRIPEFLYANPYINLGGDYEHNDPPLWALTKALMMVLDHNRSKGSLPSLELQEEVLDYALRLNVLWPEDFEVLKCTDGECIVFRGEISENAFHGFKKHIFDRDVAFYRKKGVVIGYSKERKLGYACGKDGVGKLILRALKPHEKA